MKITISDRAKEKGLLSFEVLSEVETDKYIACVIYEKRKKDGEIVEWVDPSIIFKEDVKSKDYDRALRLIEEAGFIMVMPECKNFRTDYLGMSFNGYKPIVKSWGYTSNHLPVRKRWDRAKMEEKAEEWLPDIAMKAEIIQGMIEIDRLQISDEEKIHMAKQWINENILVKNA